MRKKRKRSQSAVAVKTSASGWRVSIDRREGRVAKEGKDGRELERDEKADGRFLEKEAGSARKGDVKFEREGCGNETIGTSETAIV